MDATISDNIRALTKVLSKVEKAEKERWKFTARSTIFFSSLKKVLDCVRWGQNRVNFAKMTLVDISKDADVGSDFIDEYTELGSMLNDLIEHCEINMRMRWKEWGVDINWGESRQSVIILQKALLKDLIPAFDLWEEEKKKVNRRVGLQDEPEGRLRALYRVLNKQIKQEPDEGNLLGSRSISPVSVGQGSFKGKQGGC